jgi:hypothetical protein
MRLWTVAEEKHRPAGDAEIQRLDLAEALAQLHAMDVGMWESVVAAPTADSVQQPRRRW